MQLAILIHAAVVGAIAVLSPLLASVIVSEFTHFRLWVVALGLVGAFCIAWALFAVRIVAAHGHRVLVRTGFSDVVSLREGSFFIMFPEYVVHERFQFGPWCRRPCLPAVGQTIEIDVPEVLVTVDHGVYCLKVNTKVIGVVEQYSVDDLLRNTVPIEQRCHDVIAQALRNAVYDKPIEEALAEIQSMFVKGGDSIAQLIDVPTFKARQLLLDADQCVGPADSATAKAFELLAQRKEEVAKRSALEAALETEEQKVKLHKVSLQTQRNEFMLQQEAYGKEGAALIEAAKHAKALYLFAGDSGLSASKVLTLPM
jgi:hypothetical protein